ncbi:MAG: lysophospholipase, partial [Burkholderiales bacterium]|nr:lysophospholipase [Burkholderiales bacterium]
ATLPHWLPHITVANGLDPALLSRDPDVGDAYLADPLVHDRISPLLGRFIAEGGPEVLRHAPQWRVPTTEQRKQAAVERQLSLRPKHIVCNNCQATLTEMQPMDISGIRGIDAAFAAHCPHCDHDTYAIKGEREAVANMHMAIEDATGAESQIGAVPSANGK